MSVLRVALLLACGLALQAGGGQVDPAERALWSERADPEPARPPGGVTLDSFARLIERARPAVVAVHTRGEVEPAEETPFPFNPFWLNLHPQYHLSPKQQLHCFAHLGLWNVKLNPRPVSITVNLDSRLDAWKGSEKRRALTPLPPPRRCRAWLGPERRKRSHSTRLTFTTARPRRGRA